MDMSTSSHCSSLSYRYGSHHLRRAKENCVKPLAERYDFVEYSRAQILELMDGAIGLFFDPESLGHFGCVDTALLIGQMGMAIAGSANAYDLANFADQHSNELGGNWKGRA